VKRRDPWHRANAPSKAAADPVLIGGDAKSKSQTCLHLVCRLVAQPSVEQAEKPHSKSSGRKVLDGPATRPKTPLAVENGVGKLTASERGAPNVGMGKRAWRTPIPHLSPSDRKVGRGLMFLGWTAHRQQESPAYRRESFRIGIPPSASDKMIVPMCRQTYIRQ
jgi:hypothetical protein